MTKITTIWGGIWQSTLLAAFNEYFFDEFELTSITSMSDDWRTTWELIRNFKSEFGIHLPPPWDLRKCFYSSSKSKYIDYFKNILENVFSSSEQIVNLTIRDLFKLSTEELFENLWKVIKSKYSEAPVIFDSGFSEEITKDVKLFLNNNCWELLEYLEGKLWKYMDFKLPLPKSIKWHKFWNILMASIYYNLWDYNKMVSIMRNFLKVKWKVIPVTIEKAFIKATLENGEVVETQDNISNDADYTSKIVSIWLMDCSKNATQQKEVKNAIINTDYIIITPWDLFTSIISNFIIGWVKESIQKSKAKIIYVCNNTNKWWETFWFKIIDFVNNIEKYLWKSIDYFVCNDKEIVLQWFELEKFKSNVSVQWWDFLYLTDKQRVEIENKWIKVVSWDLIDRDMFYKHDKKNVVNLIKSIVYK